MNVTFVMTEAYKDKEADFLTFATERGMSGLKGHRSVGGFRASIYNAMPLSSVEALVETMKAYEKRI
jgi:phosphoserine aminotransferase